MGRVGQAADPYVGDCLCVGKHPGPDRTPPWPLSHVCLCRCPVPALLLPPVQRPGLSVHPHSHCPILLGGGSYAERNAGGSSPTALLVGIILALVIFAGISVHAVVTDILQILHARNATYSAVDERVDRALSVLKREMVDFDTERATHMEALLSILPDRGCSDIPLDSPLTVGEM